MTTQPTPTRRIDVERLRDLASKATPGEWAACVETAWDDGRIPSSIYSGGGVCIHSSLNPEHARNAPFIAAANPATILALLAEFEAARECIEKARHAYVRGDNLSFGAAIRAYDRAIAPGDTP